MSKDNVTLKRAESLATALNDYTYALRTIEWLKDNELLNSGETPAQLAKSFAFPIKDWKLALFKACLEQE